jgi:lipopolysaccharide transport system ATP-binding protein
MLKGIAVKFDDVGKMYRLYQNRRDSFLDISGIGDYLPGWRPKVDHFWALRHIRFELQHGSRLGIIGRNGAGKSTLLKLITRNLAPTEGSVFVDGNVQALLEAGAGFHPEFTGYENVEASLIHNGFAPSAIKEAIEEIAEFTELSNFMGQPFKTYSAGMQARLVFTTATTITPDILIVDEILGAGDAYFAMKSRARMKTLVDSGASILLVSHALDQVLQFCDEAIWIERGEIVARGSSLEVIKAYQEFVHALQDKQLKQINRKRKLGFRDQSEVEHFADTLVVAVQANRSDVTAVSRVELLTDDSVQEAVKIGGLQDSDSAHLAYVALGGWKDPEVDNGRTFRKIGAVGEMVFRSPGLEPARQHSFRFSYRSSVPVTVNASRNGEPIIVGAMLPASEQWQEQRVEIPSKMRHAEDASPRSEVMLQQANVRRWVGEGRLMIDAVDLLDERGNERAVFSVGSSLTFRLKYYAQFSDSYPVIFVIAIFRADGIKVSQHASQQVQIDATKGDKRHVDLTLSSIDVANGRYVVSAALFRHLDPQYPNEAVRYDLVDRSYEFEIVGNPPLRTSLYVLPATWRV